MLVGFVPPPNSGAILSPISQTLAFVAFKLGVSSRQVAAPPHDGHHLESDEAPVAPSSPLIAAATGSWRSPIPPTLAEIDRIFVQVFAMVGEAIAGATHALLTGDREAAKQLMERDATVDVLTFKVGGPAERQLLSEGIDVGERREIPPRCCGCCPISNATAISPRTSPRHAARGLGAEMSLRSRGLVERMGEVAATIWHSTADAFAERSVAVAKHVDDLDDELDDLHVTLTAELVAGTMAVPVAIELAMIARFYERFGDHAVILARRMVALVGGGPEPGTSGPK